MATWTSTTKSAMNQEEQNAVWSNGDNFVWSNGDNYLFQAETTNSWGAQSKS